MIFLPVDVNAATDSLIVHTTLHITVGDRQPATAKLWKELCGNINHGSHAVTDCCFFQLQPILA